MIGIKNNKTLKTKPLILTEAELLERLRKVGEKNNFIVHGFIDEYKGHKSKIDCECLIDGNKWQPSVNNVLSKNSKCPECRNTKLREDRRTSETVALNKCIEICRNFNYIPLGFPDGYKNNNSYFEYICPKIGHGKHRVLYSNFTLRDRRCPHCRREEKREEGFFGHYKHRKNDKDFLYVLNFNDQYIKVGRTFNLKRRLRPSELPKQSGISNIVKLRLYTATHQEIWDLEQELHDELRARGFQHYTNWTNECFDNDCVHVLYNLLDICGLERLY